MKYTAIEPLIDDYIDELDIPEDPWFGAPGTREIRSAQRSKKIESTIDSIKNIFSSEGSENILDDFTKDSIDPSVVQVIYRQPLDEVSKTIENAAVEFHEGIDKRPRVRMTETELGSFIKNGELVHTDPDDVIPESGKIGRRLERRLNRQKPKGEFLDIEGLSSGRKNYKNQEWQRAVAKGARDEFTRLKELGFGDNALDDLDDETLLREHGLVRSTQKSVLSDRPISSTNVNVSPLLTNSMVSVMRDLIVAMCTTPV